MGDKALSHLMVISASSGGSGIPAQLTGAGGTEQIRGTLGSRGSCLAAEPVGIPHLPATNRTASGPRRAGCSHVCSPSSIVTLPFPEMFQLNYGPHWQWTKLRKLMKVRREMDKVCLSVFHGIAKVPLAVSSLQKDDSVLLLFSTLRLFRCVGVLLQRKK